MIRAIALCLACVALPAWAEHVRPKARPTLDPIPVTRWDHRAESERWSRAGLQALKSHGAPLVEMDPRDIAAWCPGYRNAPLEDRRAFWVGFLSALAKYESTHKPSAVGGGGKWFGLLQIAPATARAYDCRAGTGEALKNGPANLSCAIRIMSETVGRDGVVHAREPRWSGVSADWGPMRSAVKRQDMRNWLRGQEYCQMQTSLRPKPRPAPEELVMGPVRKLIRSQARPELATLRRFTETRPF
ncbi:transglycosylase SLT domain-containing protein [Maribius pontilimi]|uniref:Transglycosylase SLT domain-containing protein n=1 Tax=Palleronia pontilimi TaxID=1964209 RepID=A0A934IIZ2_9RHOB|nr:transglycosylase SLT domain-containing protein [Palleronia pontilimi]MBJ3762794.1 transglycosylase SLT domain-containing protein [Palleronia pontilimi]